MIKPTKVHVDEPESLTTLNAIERDHCLLILPELINDVSFSVTNQLFISEVGRGVDVPKMARVLSSNTVFRNLTRGANYGRRHNRLMNPLEELALTLIPVLVNLRKGTEFTVILQPTNRV